MLGNLKEPPEPFKDVIRTHFKLKAQSIKKQLDKWLKDDDGRATAGDNVGMIPPLAKLSAVAKAALGGAGSSGSAFKKDVGELKAMLTHLEMEEAAGSSSSTA